MEIENEVKYKIGGNIEIIKRKLIDDLGFIFVKESNQEDYYFSPPHKNFAGTKKYYLRLRRDSKTNGAEFAYHIVRSNIRTDEWAIYVDDFNVMLKILKFLNFKIDCVINKKRLSYKNNSINIVVDNIKNLGSFIEIEYCGKFSKDIKNKFEKIAAALSVKKEDCIKGMGYPDLLMQKLHNNQK